MYLEKLRLDGRVAFVTGGGAGDRRPRPQTRSGKPARRSITGDLARRRRRRSTSPIPPGSPRSPTTSCARTAGSTSSSTMPGSPAARPRPRTSADEHWLNVLDVNLNGSFWCARAFGRHMLAAGRGAIVNVGSMSGMIVNRPQPQSYYNASKAAVHQLTKIARRRMGAARRAGQRGRADLYQHAAQRLRRPRGRDVPALDRRNADGPARRARGGRLGHPVPRLGRVEPDDRQHRRSPTAATPAGKSTDPADRHSRANLSDRFILTYQTGNDETAAEAAAFTLRRGSSDAASSPPCLPVPLCAVAAPVAGLGPGRQSPRPSAPTTDAAAEPASDADIVVTARKREETLQDVPVAITAITGDTLESRGHHFGARGGGADPGPQHQQRRRRPRLRRDPRRRRDPGPVGPAGRRPVHRRHLPAQHLLSEQPARRRRADRGAARAAGHALRQEHAGRRDQRHHRASRPTSSQVRGMASYAGPDDSWLVSGSISGPIIADKLQVRVAAAHREQDGFLRNTLIGGNANPFNTDTLNATIRARAGRRRHPDGQRLLRLGRRREHALRPGRRPDAIIRATSSSTP